jgi:Fuc2NAc and GlcNAc transferase
MRLLPLLIAFAVSVIATPLCRAFALRRGLLDVPNDASSHAIPTPRNGGVAIVTGLAIAAIVVLRSAAGWALLAPALAMAALAAVDELRPLPRGPRLVLQVGIAVGALAVLPSLIPRQLEIGGVVVPLGIAGAAFALVWLVGAVNGFNFMDGLNGLSSSAAIVCGVTAAILSLRHHDAPGAVLGLAIAGGAAGFLPWNLPSGSIFMGDVGSATLGLLLGAMVLYLTSIGVPFGAAMLPLASFVSDALLAVIRRAVKGERFFATRHRSHFYQLLNQQGWPHAAVTAVWAVLMLLSAGAALAYEALSATGRMAALASIAAMHALVFSAIVLRRRPPAAP